MRSIPNDSPRCVEDLNPWRSIQTNHALPGPCGATAPQWRVIIVSHQISVSLEVQAAQAGRAAGGDGVSARPDGLPSAGVVGVVDDNIAVALVLHNDAVKPSKGRRIRGNSERVEAICDGVG